MTNTADATVEISITGLEVFAHHGLLPEERERGQVFLIDLEMELSDCPACGSDRIGDTVDYAAVIECAAGVATGSSYDLLEKLAAEMAGTILERFSPVTKIKVRVAKAAPPLPHAVGSVSVAVAGRHRPGREL